MYIQKHSQKIIWKSERFSYEYVAFLHEMFSVQYSKFISWNFQMFLRKFEFANNRVVFFTDFEFSKGTYLNRFMLREMFKKVHKQNSANSEVVLRNRFIIRNWLVFMHWEHKFSLCSNFDGNGCLILLLIRNHWVRVLKLFNFTFNIFPNNVFKYYQHFVERSNPDFFWKFDFIFVSSKPKNG